MIPTCRSDTKSVAVWSTALVLLLAGELTRADERLVHMRRIATVDDIDSLNFEMCVTSDEPKLLVNRSEKLFCWNLESGDHWEVRGPELESSASITSLATDEAGRVIVVGFAGQGVCTIDRASLARNSPVVKVQQQWNLNGRYVHQVRRSAASHMIAASTEGGLVYLIDDESASGRPRKIEVGGLGATVIEFLNQGKLLAIGTYDGTVDFYDTRSLDLRKALTAPANGCNDPLDSEGLVGREAEGTGAIAVDSASKHLSVLSRGCLDVYSLPDCKHTYRVSLPGRSAWNVLPHPIRPEWLVGASSALDPESGCLYLISSHTGMIQSRVDLTDQTAYHIACSPDGRWLAVCGVLEINVWRINDR